MKKHCLSIVLFLLLNLPLQAQQSLPFQAGEFLSYNLYYNWQFVWIKAGSASMYTVKTTYEGQTAYRTSLITRGSTKADQYFVMRDTLLSYLTPALNPLYYRKGAREGKRYYVDEVFYTYPSPGKSHVRQHQLTSKGLHEWREKSTVKPVYDMLSMFQRARGFNPSGWQPGHTIDFPMVDGHKIETARLKYRGKTTIKADDGQRYDCLKISYLEFEDNKWKEIVTFFVTDDAHHVPVQLDMNLRVGTAKAILQNAKGVQLKSQHQ